MIPLNSLNNQPQSPLVDKVCTFCQRNDGQLIQLPYGSYAHRQCVEDAALSKIVTKHTPNINNNLYTPSTLTHIPIRTEISINDKSIVKHQNLSYQTGFDITNKTTQEYLKFHITEAINTGAEARQARAEEVRP